jgi:hypothetical protein
MKHFLIFLQKITKETKRWLYFFRLGGETLPPRSLPLQQNRFDGAGFFYASELGIETLEFEVEAIVIDAHAIQHGRVEVEDADGIAQDVVAEVIRFTDGHAGLDAAACEENGEAARVVIAAVIVLGQGSL